MYRAPFPWFGGKSRAVNIVWPQLGVVRNYVEPFAGSLACLFLRPKESLHPTRPNIETVNDIDCFVANFWRSCQQAPDGVAYWADWPVCEADLHARHDWLVFKTADWRQRMHRDPDYYDIKVAGWWVWGICQWIGDGWCADYGMAKAGKARKQTIRDPITAGGRVHRPKQDTEPVTQRSIPQLTGVGPGINCIDLATPQAMSSRRQAALAKLLELARAGVSEEDRDKILARIDQPDLADSHMALQFKEALGQETPQKIPQLCRHQDVHCFDFGPRTPQKIPIIHNNGVGIHRPGTRADLYPFMESIGERLRGVRIVCGDWSRVVKPAVTTNHGQTALLLDPPYSSEGQNPCNIFAQADTTIAQRVREWCAANGANPDYRIALCGHGHEHTELEALGWTPVKLNGTNGYSHSREDSVAAQLAKSETIWFSPWCVKVDDTAKERA